MNRDAIYTALFARVQALPGVVTASRKLRHWSDVPAKTQPAAFLTTGRQTPTTQSGMPTKWLLEAELYLYVNTKGGLVPGTVLNNLLDAVEALFPLHPVVGLHLLPLTDGYWARIGGAIETDEGTLGDQAVAIIPIQILAT